MGCSSSNRVSDVAQSITVNKKQKSQHFTSVEWPELPDKLSCQENLMVFARSKKRQSFDNLDQVALHIKSFPTQNDIEIVWLVYVWIADNIEYDFEGYKKNSYGNNESEEVFRSGKAVCEGYANLFQSLCEKIGIECKKIIGYSKGYSYFIGKKFNETDHAWNVVKINKRWYFVDSTWGSGVIENEKFKKKFNPYWFFVPEKVFIETHFSPEFQLEKNISLGDFEKSLPNELCFHIHGFQELNLPLLVETDHSPFCLELFCNQDCLVIASLRDFQTSCKLLDALIQKDCSSNPHKHCIIFDIPEKNVKYNVEIYSKRANSEETIYSCITSFFLVRKKDFINRNIPKYNLDFGSSIKLLSHSSSYLYFDQNPLLLELSGAENFALLANLNNENDSKIDNACLVQKSLDKKKFLLYVSCPKQGKFYLNIFFNENNGQDYDFLTKLVLTKEKPVQPKDIMKFVHLYNKEAFIEKPLGFQLKIGVEYEFKIYLNNAIKLALIDPKNNWNYFSIHSDGCYLLKWTAKILGTVNIYAQINQDSIFESLCNYECIN